MKQIANLLSRDWFWSVCTATLLSVGLLAVFVEGLQLPTLFVSGPIYSIGHAADGTWFVPPFPPLTGLQQVYTTSGTTVGPHFYLLGSDGAGHDLLGLMAKGAEPSLALVALALLGRMAVGILAGVAMAMGSTIVRTLSQGMGRWFAGFPYLAFAIVLIQVIGPHSRFAGFVVAMAAVGWRDVAEVVSSHVEAVLAQPYTEAAHALGSQGWTYFKRHAIPHLVPALAIEIPFQASGLLVLLAELGYLNVYLASRLNTVASSPGVVDYRVVGQPELGALLADARHYILTEHWAQVLIPGVAIALLALAFELFGWSLRLREQARLGGIAAH